MPLTHQTPWKALVSTSIVRRGFEGAIFLLRLLNRIFTDLILLLLDLSILFLSDLYFSFSFPLLTKGIWEGGMEWVVAFGTNLH